MNKTFAHDEQYRVNWGEVSGNADFAVYKMEMYNTDGKLVQCINLNTQYRPKPTPHVEVGQVWKRLNTESDFLISIIGGLFKTGDDWEESVTYQAKASGDYYTRAMSDFVEKFVRVSD